jgi:hypothetical protein
MSRYIFKRNNNCKLTKQGGNCVLPYSGVQEVQGVQEVREVQEVRGVQGVRGVLGVQREYREYSRCTSNII